MNSIIEIGISSVATIMVATNINADTLLTALIGLGVSIVTVVGGELVKFLVAYLQRKTKDLKEPTDDKEK